jgi:signal transduction histidine kinase
LCKQLSIRHNLKIDFDCEGMPDQLPKELSLCFYRVLQEALQNALKHSRSESLHVSLNGTTSEIRLTVRDFGIGFDPSAEVVLLAPVTAI